MLEGSSLRRTPIARPTGARRRSSATGLSLLDGGEWSTPAEYASYREPDPLPPLPLTPYPRKGVRIRNRKLLEMDERTHRYYIEQAVTDFLTDPGQANAAPLMEDDEELPDGWGTEE